MCDPVYYPAVRILIFQQTVRKPWVRIPDGAPDVKKTGKA